MKGPGGWVGGGGKEAQTGARRHGSGPLLPGVPSEAPMSRHTPCPCLRPHSGVAVRKTGKGRGFDPTQGFLNRDAYHPESWLVFLRFQPRSQHGGGRACNQHPRDPDARAACCFSTVTVPSPCFCHSTSNGRGIRFRDTMSPLPAVTLTQLQ